MRATEFIRGLLDLIDSVDGQENTQVTDYEDENAPESDIQGAELANTPDEMYVDHEVILSIGNDINKPKHPSDLRANSVSMYPNMQYKSGE